MIPNYFYNFAQYFLQNMYSNVILFLKDAFIWLKFKYFNLIFDIYFNNLIYIMLFQLCLVLIMHIRITYYFHSNFISGKEGVYFLYLFYIFFLYFSFRCLSNIYFYFIVIGKISPFLNYYFIFLKLKQDFLKIKNLYSSYFNFIHCNHSKEFNDLFYYIFTNFFNYFIHIFIINNFIMVIKLQIFCSKILNHFKIKNDLKINCFFYLNQFLIPTLNILYQLLKQINRPFIIIIDFMYKKLIVSFINLYIYYYFYYLNIY